MPGRRVADVCRKHGISQPTYYNWKSKYGGSSVSELKRTKELEAEHSKLKRMYANLAMENDALKELIENRSDVDANGNIGCKLTGNIGSIFVRFSNVSGASKVSSPSQRRSP